MKQNLHPAITRPDAGITLVSKWRVEVPEHQTIAGDTAIDVWKNLMWPEGLLSHNVYLGNDGLTVLQYSQWTGEEAIEAFKQREIKKRVQIAYETVPGLDRVEAVNYRYYRSMFSDDISRHAGCIIIVSFETDDSERQQAFVDTLIHMVESKENPHHPGSIASHFHLSTNGKRVLNYAEFLDEQSHEEVVQTMLQRDDELPRLISSMPGLTPLGFERFQLYRSLSI